jgi:hypothetical protein
LLQLPLAEIGTGAVLLEYRFFNKNYNAMTLAPLWPLFANTINNTKEKNSTNLKMKDGRLNHPCIIEEFIVFVTLLHLFAILKHQTKKN